MRIFIPSPNNVGRTSRETSGTSRWTRARSCRTTCTASLCSTRHWQFQIRAARRINRVRQTPGVPVWQRNYYELVIRNETELERIRAYIAANPTRWALDRENPERLAARDQWTADEDQWFTSRSSDP
jgi:hypothetical protein